MRFKAIACLALALGIGCLSGSPAFAQQKTPGPKSETTPGTTLPEIMPCDAEALRRRGTTDKIVVVPTPEGTASDDRAVVAPPADKPSDRGATVQPPKERSVPDNLPECTLPATRSQPD